MSRVLEEENSFIQRLDIPIAVPSEKLVPEGLTAIHRYVGHSTTDVFAHGKGGSVLIECLSGATWITAAASSESNLDALIADLSERGREAMINHVTEDVLQVSFWSHSSSGGSSLRHKNLQPIAWRDAKANYPKSVRRRLDRLMNSGPPSGTARLILWHGEPGTGKTSALVALIDSIQSWCDAHVITDPELLFERCEYLNDVLIADIHKGRLIQRDAPTPPTWRIVIAEDADEYLRSDARRRSGPALGKLLNASDGLVGRGTNTLFLLTTNDEVGRLHPAITRPGRCISVVEFDRFPPAEAGKWLGPNVSRPTVALTLAELYQIRQGADAPVGPSAGALTTGAYL